MPVVRGVLRNAAKDNYAMQSIVTGIVQSSAFRMRTKLPELGAANTVAQNAEKE
jgi:hypothetical protein